MQPVIIGQTRKGQTTASAGNIRIHSAYNPEKEASRYIESLNPDIRKDSTVIVLGGALGYLEDAIVQKYPDTRILVFVLDDVLARSRKKEDHPCWFPGLCQSPEAFLMANLGEYDIPGLRIVEWAASLQVRVEIAGIINKSIAALVRFHSGNISATAAFGRHWIRNMLRNYLELEETVVPQRDDRAVVIAASGPSLEEALPILLRYRDRIRLWALPSSVPALTSSGLSPDLVFATDSGYWARLHTRYFCPETPVAMPLSAVPLPKNAGPALLLPQGTPGEDQLLADNRWQSLDLPQMGTVAATAMEAWKRLSKGPLALVGLDLAWTDLRSHTRPHAFDSWLDSITGRHKPALTVAWERAGHQVPDRKGSLRTGPALRTYADWFSGNIPEREVIRFKSQGSCIESADIPGLEWAGEEWFENLKRNNSPVKGMQIRKSPLNRKERIKNITKLLSDWIKKIGEPDRDGETARLMYTLDPGGVLKASRLKGETREAALANHEERVLSILEGLAGKYE